MGDFSIVQRAVAGEVGVYDQAAAILLSEALAMVASCGAQQMPWQEMLWAAQLAMEEVFAFDASTLTQDDLHTAMRQKIFRLVNGLDHEQMEALRQRPDAYVNRLFGMEE